jgi:hypothetical protein
MHIPRPPELTRDFQALLTLLQTSANGPAVAVHARAASERAREPQIKKALAALAGGATAAAAIGELAPGPIRDRLAAAAPAELADLKRALQLDAAAIDAAMQGPTSSIMYYALICMPIGLTAMTLGLFVVPSLASFTPSGTGGHGLALGQALLPLGAVVAAIGAAVLTQAKWVAVLALAPVRRAPLAELLACRARILGQTADPGALAPAELAAGEALERAQRLGRRNLRVVALATGLAAVLCVACTMFAIYPFIWSLGSYATLSEGSDNAP